MRATRDSCLFSSRLPDWYSPWLSIQHRCQQKRRMTRCDHCIASRPAPNIHRNSSFFLLSGYGKYADHRAPCCEIQSRLSLLGAHIGATASPHGQVLLSVVLRDSWMTGCDVPCCGLKVQLRTCIFMSDVNADHQLEAPHPIWGAPANGLHGAPRLLIPHVMYPSPSQSPGSRYT